MSEGYVDIMQWRIDRAVRAYLEGWGGDLDGWGGLTLEGIGG